METQTVVRIDLPLATIEPYQQEADRRKVPLADVVKSQLKRCKNYKASKPLYFNDEQRAKLETILGVNCEDAESALLMIKEITTFKVGGVEVVMSDYDIRRLRGRLRRDKSFAGEVKWLITKLLQRYLQGEI